jgi:hypothetical protein
MYPDLEQEAKININQILSTAPRIYHPLQNRRKFRNKNVYKCKYYLRLEREHPLLITSSIKSFKGNKKL